MSYGWQSRRRKSIRLGGVALEALQAERSVGKRSQVHTYAGRDDPYTQEFGRAPRTFRLDCVVVGDDYDVRLEELARKIERPGRLRLEGWFASPIAVVAQRAGAVERFDAQGMARVSIECVEAGRPLSPTPESSAGLISRLVESIRAAAVDRFPEIASSIESVGSLGDRMLEIGQELEGELAATLDDVDQNVGSAEDAASKLSEFGADLASLSSNSLELARRVDDVVAEIAAAPGSSIAKYTTLRLLAGFGNSLEPVDVSTPTQALEAGNQTAISDLVARLAALHAAEISSSIGFSSATDAAEHRDELSELLDLVLLAAADGGADEIYSGFRNLKALTTRDLDLRAARLPRRVILELWYSVPALVLSFRLYGETSRADELVARNAIRNPAFMPGSVPLEVLSEVPSGG